MRLEFGAAIAQSRRGLCLVALAPMLASAPAAAQVTPTPAAPAQTPNAQGATPVGQQAADPNTIRGLEIHGGIGVDEIFTDNARGVASGGLLTVQSNGTVTATPQAKVSDVVTRVTPLLSVVDRTSRLQAGLVFQPSYQKYALASDLDRFDNSLLGNASAELWREHFLVEGSLSMSRQIINNQAAVATTGTTTSNNQADLNSYFFSPTYRQAFGTFALGELQYRFGETSSGVIAPATSNGITATLKNGADVNRLTSTFTLDASRTSQGSTPNAGQIVNNAAVPTTTNSTSRRAATLDSRYALTHIVALLGGFGYEEITNGSLSRNPKGPIGNFGIGLTGARSQLNVKVNFRYDTQFISLDGKYDLGRQLHLTASYNQSVTTSQEQTLDTLTTLRLAANGGLVSSQSGQPFIPLNPALGVNSGVGNTAFRDRTGQIGLTGIVGRNTYTFGILDENRTTDTTNFNETVVALNGAWARDLTPLTKFNLNLGYTLTDDRGVPASSDNTYSASTGLSYQLNQGLTATATYSIIYRRSNQPGQDIRENSFLIGLRKTI